MVSCSTRLNEWFGRILLRIDRTIHESHGFLPPRVSRRLFTPKRDRQRALQNAFVRPASVRGDDTPYVYVAE